MLGDEALLDDTDFPGYSEVELIGSGGMAQVYRARHDGLDRSVALKVLSSKYVGDPEFSERFSREARTVARLDHSNVVTVYDVGEIAAGRPFFSMEWIDGVTLREMMGKGIAPSRAVEIALQICDALEYFHEKGIVHRDIKPGNILLSKNGMVKVADFGLTGDTDERGKDSVLTKESSSIGTPAYMAPEQFGGFGVVDGRADIYALGAIIYEMFTGDIPLGAFQPPSQIVGGVSPEVDRIIARAMQRDPSRRYRIIRDLRKDLQQTDLETMPGQSLRKKIAICAASVSIVAVLVVVAFFPGVEDVARIPPSAASFGAAPRPAPATVDSGRPVVISLSVQASENHPAVPSEQNFTEIRSRGNRSPSSLWFAGMRPDRQVVAWGPNISTVDPNAEIAGYRNLIQFEMDEQRFFGIDRDHRLFQKGPIGEVSFGGFPINRISVGCNFIFALDREGRIASDTFGVAKGYRSSLPDGHEEMRFVKVAAGYSMTLFVRDDGVLFANATRLKASKIGRIDRIPVHVHPLPKGFILTMPDGTFQFIVENQFVPSPFPALGKIDDAERVVVKEWMHRIFVGVERKGGGWHLFEYGGLDGTIWVKRRKDLESQLSNAIDLAFGTDYLVALIP